MEAPPVSHPAAGVLKAFALGKLDEPTAAVVLSHLEVCSDCFGRVSALSGDTFLTRLREMRNRSGTALPGQLPLSQPQPSTPAVADLPPELRDHEQYEVVAELGRGGMGVVYLVRNRNMVNRLEALKIINPFLLTHPAAVQRFQREIEAAARLNHPHIVTSYAVVQRGTLLGLAMEYVPGHDLAKVVEDKGPLPVSNACSYISQVALGLQYAFERKMVHRDIKPQNLILDYSGKQHVLKIVDFGLAKVTSEAGGAGPNLTGTGAMMGTPDYLAPEQAEDAAQADIRADLYSLGCTLYFLLAGRSPFPARSRAALVYAHATEVAEPLDHMRNDVPAKLAAVVAKLMAKEPGKRYQEPVKVARELAPFARGGLKPLQAVGKTPLVATPVQGPNAGSAAKSVPPRPVIESRETIGRVRQQTAVPPPLPGGTQGEGNAAIARVRQEMARPAPAQKARRWPWVVGAAALLVVVLVGLWAGGVFRVKTKEGILVVEVDEPNTDVYLDGGRVAVSWEKNGKRAELRVKPGTHRVEIKKDGITVLGEEVELRDGDRRILTARLVVRAPPAKPIETPPVKPPEKPPEKPPAKPREKPPDIPVEKPPEKPPAKPPAAGAIARPALLDCTGEDGVSAAEMRAAQAAWAKYLGRKVEETVEIADGVTMTFVLVPPGKFRMGSPTGEAKRYDDEALHEVTLTEPFYLSKYEVTQEQYEALTRENPSKFKGKDRPVEEVSWEEAKSFGEKLTTKLGDKHLYRLPTEAEWEYSCRGGRPSSKPFGIGDGLSLSSRQSNFDGNYPYGDAEKGPYLESTCKVGSYSANALGLYDMHGNVWEWCADWYGPYSKEDATNPTGPTTGSSRVYRGGSWSNDARYCRAANRFRYVPGCRNYNLGFRLARSSPSGVK